MPYPRQWSLQRRPSGFIEPCLPSKVARPPSGPLWVHEIKHDGYRLMVRRDGSRVRCFTRNGHDWADRFPAIVDAALRLRAQSFLIDGEAVIARDDGRPDERGRAAIAVACNYQASRASLSDDGSRGRLNAALAKQGTVKERLSRFWHVAWQIT